MYYIIANPNSERGGTMFLLPTLITFFEDAGLPYDTHVLSVHGDAYHRTLKVCQNTHDLQGVIAIGGDGTVQEVAAGMVAAFRPGKIPVPLGILSSATGSDFTPSLVGGKTFAKALFKKHISERCRTLFEAVANRRLRAVDIITSKDMAFLNIGHVGLDTHIVVNANEIKEKYDQKSYLAVAYKSITQYKSIHLVIETFNGAESETHEGEFTLVAVANGQYYGGGMRICPDAKIDDGKITLCLIRAMSQLKTMLIFPSILIEKHSLLKTVSFVECDRVKITLPPDCDEPLCLDGNIYPCAGETEFSVLPGALDIYDIALEGKPDVY